MGKIAAVTAVLLAAVSGAFAVNQADVTGPFRYCPSEFYQALYNSSDTWSGFSNQPLGDSSCISLFESHHGSSALHEFAFTTLLSDNWQTGLVADLFGGEKSDAYTFLADYRQGQVGLGVLEPLSGGKARVSGRFYSGDWAAFARVGGGAPIVGLSHYAEKTTIDVAYGDDRWYVDLCQQHGQWTPELRMTACPEGILYTFLLGYTKD